MVFVFQHLIFIFSSIHRKNDNFSALLEVTLYKIDQK